MNDLENMRDNSKHMLYGFDERPNTILSEEAQQNLERIKNSEYSVLVGRNNCGKSFLLKTLTEQIGQEAAYIGPARYTNFNSLSFYQPNKRRKRQWWDQFQRWRRENHTMDNSPINLQQAIAEFDDATRQTFFELMTELLGVEIEIAKADPSNEMSQPYLRCGGHNLSFTSSGTRLIASILTCLLDKEYKTILIDEPELGISPEAQGTLADFLFDKTSRKRFFPHIETLVFATHSTVFLDRRRISNNYMVSKAGDEINIVQSQSQQDINNIHFFLLGNRFETLYLPSGIFIVEGKCEEVYLRRILEILYPDAVFSVILAGDDSRISQVVNMACNFFSDIQKSPYRDRIVPVLDSVHAKGLVEKIEKQGISKGNIVVWEQNGIEFYYPDEILDEIFGEGGVLEINDDIVSRNGISYKKYELAEKVTAGLTKETKYPEELKTKLFPKISTMVGLT